MAVYGSRIGRVEEQAVTLGDVGPYSAAKTAVEHMAAGQPAVVILRPGCIYGPGSSQWSTRIAKWLRAHRIGDRGANGDGFSNLVYIDDVVAAIVRSLTAEHAGGRTYNLAARPRVRWNEYFMAFARALGAVPVSRITRRSLKLETRLLAPPLKVAEILAGRLQLGRDRIPEPIPPSLARLWAQQIELDSSRAERELGIAWTPLERGLGQTVAGLRGPGLPS
jgi:nucleoside-diphosphate-sugar epimerase